MGGGHNGRGWGREGRGYNGNTPSANIENTPIHWKNVNCTYHFWYLYPREMIY